MPSVARILFSTAKFLTASIPALSLLYLIYEITKSTFDASPFNALSLLERQITSWASFLGCILDYCKNDLHLPLTAGILNLNSFLFLLIVSFPMSINYWKKFEPPDADLAQFVKSPIGFVAMLLWVGWGFLFGGSSSDAGTALIWMLLFLPLSFAFASKFMMRVLASLLMQCIPQAIVFLIRLIN